MKPIPHPPRWAFTVYGVSLASVHLLAATFDVGRSFDLWEMAWPFYAALIGTTSAAAAYIDRNRRRYGSQAGEQALPDHETED